MVIRVFVLPSLMALLGRANWWPGRVEPPTGTRIDDQPTERLPQVPQLQR
jgi:RND superfamily putative drug exporter